MADQSVHLKFGGNAAASVDAYLEYKRIVGEDDGGKTFTPDQYEAYKKRVLPMRMKNRLYTAWISPTMMDCKLIGPETQCFCGHRYHQHKTDFEKIPTERPILLPCQVKGCGCRSYHYVPLNGSQPIRCKCKAYSDEHSVVKPYKSKKAGSKCTGFTSSYTCGCGQPYSAHEMLVETKEERLARGHPVGQDVPCSMFVSLSAGTGSKCTGFTSSYTCGCGQPYSAHEMLVETKEERLARGHPVGQDVPYKAMGGLTGFSSLMEGYMRLDPSGVGAPPMEFLDQPITSSDHPFLRANVESIKQHKLKQKALTGKDDPSIDADLAERMSAMKKPGESDMDFYERRYQERDPKILLYGKEIINYQMIKTPKFPNLKKPGESDMDFYERRYQERQKAERERARASRALPAGRGGAVVGKRAPITKK